MITLRLWRILYFFQQLYLLHHEKHQREYRREDQQKILFFAGQITHHYAPEHPHVVHEVKHRLLKHA